MTQSVRAPIFNPAGVLADNRNLWQGSSGWRVCLCVVRVDAFKKSRGVDKKTRKRCIKMNRQGGKKTKEIKCQHMKPSSRRRRLNGVCLCEWASELSIVLLKITDTIYGELLCEQRIWNWPVFAGLLRQSYAINFPECRWVWRPLLFPIMILNKRLTGLKACGQLHFSGPTDCDSCVHTKLDVSQRCFQQQDPRIFLIFLFFF